MSERMKLILKILMAVIATILSFYGIQSCMLTDSTIRLNLNANSYVGVNGQEAIVDSTGMVVSESIKEVYEDADSD